MKSPKKAYVLHLKEILHSLEKMGKYIRNLNIHGVHGQTLSYKVAMSMKVRFTLLIVSILSAYSLAASPFKAGVNVIDISADAITAKIIVGDSLEYPLRTTLNASVISTRGKYLIGAKSSLPQLPDKAKSTQQFAPNKRFRDKSPWSLNALVGVDYVALSNTFDVWKLDHTRTFARTSAAVYLTRRFRQKWHVSVGVQGAIHSEQLRYSDQIVTTFTSYYPEASIVDGQFVPDTVTTSQIRTRSINEDNKTTSLDLQIFAGYLIQGRTCDYTIFGGLDYRILEAWEGNTFRSSNYANSEVNAITLTDQKPYETTQDLRYTVGTRSYLPLGKDASFMIEARVQFGSARRYEVSNSNFQRVNETAVGLRSGLSYRF